MVLFLLQRISQLAMQTCSGDTEYEHRHDVERLLLVKMIRGPSTHSL